MLEQIIRKISATVAGIVVFALAGGLYLGAKGFALDENGNFVLVRSAEAAGENVAAKDIPQNFGFPQDHVLGSEKAPVTLYEYSSFGCFHCADFHLEVLPKIVKQYVESGKVRVVFVPLPLDKNSMDAALLAECIDKDKYFSFVDVLFKKQRDWNLAFDPQKVLKQYAVLSGLSDEKANVCLKNDVTAARILKDRRDALSELNVSGTPSFFVSSAKETEAVEGILPFEDFAVIIDEHLNLLSVASK